MTRFNYLGESLPSLIDRLRGIVVPANLRSPLGALLTAILIVCAWSVIESTSQRQADTELEIARQRLRSTQGELAKLRLEREGADATLALDAQLRGIRRSGALLGSQLADMANRLPAQAWLQSIDRTGTTLDITGETTDLQALSRTVTSMDERGALEDTQLIRAASLEGAYPHTFVAFELRATLPAP